MSSIPSALTDPTRCPLCGAGNRCAMEAARDSGQPQPPCWCTQVAFNRAVLARIPTASRGLACICQACASAASAASEAPS